LHAIGLKARAKALEKKGEEVPNYMELPNLEDILKMRQSLTTNSGVEDEGQYDTKSFVFVTKYLVGAVLGKKEWENYKLHHRVLKHFTKTDKAFLYVVLVNSYDLWKNTEGIRVGTGKLTQDGSNKKYCGWTKEGIKMYNKILEKVKANRIASWAQKVEDKVMETMRDRHKNDERRNTIVIRCRKKRVHDYDSGKEEDGDYELDADNDLSTVFAYSI
jgi:hypothetical protein